MLLSGRLSGKIEHFDFCHFDYVHIIGWIVIEFKDRFFNYFIENHKKTLVHDLIIHSEVSGIASHGMELNTDQ